MTPVAHRHVLTQPGSLDALHEGYDTKQTETEGAHNDFPPDKVGFSQPYKLTPHPDLAAGFFWILTPAPRIRPKSDTTKRVVMCPHHKRKVSGGCSHPTTRLTYRKSETGRTAVSVFTVERDNSGTGSTTISRADGSACRNQIIHN